jgi:chemotaxis protein CheX
MDSTSSKKNMDTVASELSSEVIEAFLRGTVETFAVQFGVEVKPGAPYLRKPDDGVEGDIGGVIAMHDPRATGIVAILMPAQVFLTVIGKLLGMEATELTSDLEDGAAEILNMIYGLAKDQLNRRGYEIDRAIPTIVRGNGIRLKHQSRSLPIVVPFEVGGMPAGVPRTFYVEIGLERK